jgi:hypothetical protein
VVRAWQAWAPAAPDPLWSTLRLTAAAGHPARISVGGAYAGTVAGATTLLDQLYDAAGSGPDSSSVQEKTYLDAMLANAGCSGLQVRQCHTQPGGQLPRVPAFAKSDFFSTELDAAAIDALLTGVEAMSNVHGSAGGLGEVSFDALGGALNRRP